MFPEAASFDEVSLVVLRVVVVVVVLGSKGLGSKGLGSKGEEFSEGECDSGFVFVGQVFEVVVVVVCDSREAVENLGWDLFGCVWWSVCCGDDVVQV